MLGKILGAQAELEAQMLELRQSGADASLTAEATNQLSALVALQNNISAAKPGALASLKAQVIANVSASSNVAQGLRQATAVQAGETAQMSLLSANLRREVNDLRGDLFERRIFDRYMTFGSKEEEEAFRRRDEEARRYIERQLRSGTPEGELNAAGATMDRMLDAHAHGARNSPEFMPRWNRLAESTAKMREGLRKEGRSTEEFDRNLRESVRRYLRSKGLTDAEIEAKLAVSTDPLEAVKPYLRTEKDANALDVVLQSTKAIEDSSVRTVVKKDLPDGDAALVIAKQASADVGLADVMAKFQAAGVSTPSSQTGNGHGLAAATGGTGVGGPIPPR